MVLNALSVRVMRLQNLTELQGVVHPVLVHGRYPLLLTYGVASIMTQGVISSIVAEKLLTHVFSLVLTGYALRSA